MREVVQPLVPSSSRTAKSSPGYPETKKPRRSGALGTRGNGVWEDLLLEERPKPRRKLHIHSFHSAHPAHSAVSMAAGILLLFDQFGHHRLSREKQPGNRSRVLQRGAAHLGRIEDAHFDQ